jgi:PhzF family phenazine biosynthesis protein
MESGKSAFRNFSGVGAVAACRDMTSYVFQQVDVFASAPFKGNPLAVVLEADGISDAQMAAFGNWTNLSETTFLLKPSSADADYRLRIFTPQQELPFAGHPTLGSCHVWLAAGNKPKGEHVVQECGAGLVKIRRDGERLAFAAPALRRSGEVEESIVEKIARGLKIARSAIKAAQWCDNGPGWIAVMLATRAEVLALEPDFAALADLKLGVVGPWDKSRDGDEAQFELRAFVTGGGYEDPVTGSLNASVAQWLIGKGVAPDNYVASQGTALGRAGRVYVARDGNEIWIGGKTISCIQGKVEI